MSDNTHSRNAARQAVATLFQRIMDDFDIALKDVQTYHIDQWTQDLAVAASRGYGGPMTDHESVDVLTAALVWRTLPENDQRHYVVWTRSNWD